LQGPPSDPKGSDEDLVRATLAGDARAFEALLGRHEARVLRLLRFLGVPPVDREDVAQNVFLRVFRHLGRYRPGRPFEAWLYRITVNAAHDHRAGLARTRAGIVDRDSSPEPILDPQDAPDAVADRSALRARLERSLDALSERERAVFVLREIEGLDGLAVARALGITRITVRRHLGRARERLRAEMEKEPCSGKNERS